MRITVKTGLVAAATWILFKLCLFAIGVADSTTVITVLANIFMLLSSISIGLYLQKRSDTEETNTLIDVKNGMSAGLPYVVLTSVFIYFYYGKINPDYYKHQIAEKEYMIHQMVNDPVQLKKLNQNSLKTTSRVPQQVSLLLYQPYLF